MTRRLRYLVAVCVTLGLAGGVARLSVLWGGYAADAGQLTIDIRLTRNIATQCREYTADELRTIPAHMRTAQHCDRTAVPYRRRIVIDGVEADAVTLLAPGGRTDRPLIDTTRWPVTPGVHQVDIRCAPDAASSAATTPTYALARDIVVGAGRIVFVTLDEDAGTFVISE